MTIDELIEIEFKLYLKRYNAYQDSEKQDEIAKMMTAESERILKQLYHLKHNPADEQKELLGYVAFMANLGKKYS